MPELTRPRFVVLPNDEGDYFINQLTEDEAGTIRRDTVLDTIPTQNEAVMIARCLNNAARTFSEILEATDKYKTDNTITLTFRWK